jgi:hypothetical protein
MRHPVNRRPVADPRREQRRLTMNCRTTQEILAWAVPGSGRIPSPESTTRLTHSWGTGLRCTAVRLSSAMPPPGTRSSGAGRAAQELDEGRHRVACDRCGGEVGLCGQEVKERLKEAGLQAVGLSASGRRERSASGRCMA